MNIAPKKIEIFTGTGGVGKTTLATSRAVFLAREGLNVLLITIDPSKRLKQVLNLEDGSLGEVHKVSLNSFLNDASTETMDALLFSPGATLKNVAIDNDSSLDNPILKNLSKPYGGLNEIMAMVELNHQLNKDTYDCIVLDTPPGKHFIDFLDSGRKINAFFDNSFIEIFKLFGRSIDNLTDTKRKSPFFSAIVNTGVKKLLGYLEKVTGKKFVDTFVGAILAIYQCKHAFLDSLKLQEDLYNPELTNLILVTSVEHDKLKEAEKMHLRMNKNVHGKNYLVINRCQTSSLSDWQPVPDSPLAKVKDSMLARENKLKNYAREKFQNIKEFPDIIDISPGKHVEHLSKFWSE